MIARGTQDDKNTTIGFFSTEKGKAVILGALILVAGIVYFVFYTNNDAALEGQTTQSVPSSNTASVTQNVSTNGNTSVNQESIEPNTLTNPSEVSNAENNISDVKDVFNPLVKEKSSSVPDNKPQQVVDNTPVNFIPDNSPVVIQDNVPKQIDDTDKKKNEPTIEQPPKQSIGQVVSAKVTGVVGTGDTAYVIMEVDGKSQIYRKGDLVREDIKVSDISSNAVTLSRENEKFEIQLGGK